MEVNKVVYGGNTLIDLTNDTVTADKLLKGTKAHNAAGAQIEGTAGAYVDENNILYIPSSQATVSGEVLTIF